MKALTNIGIVGGGTSGYLTALCINKLLPEVEVTVIESPSIPIIGVGESTTPKLLRMLHDVLEFDLSEFYKEVKPTWKQGVRYLWGDPKYDFTNNALGFISPFLSIEVNEDINYNSLNSVLMNADKSFMVKTGNPESPYKSYALPHSYAYHLDNERLSAFLKRKAKERGVSVLERTIVEVQLGDDTVKSLKFKEEDESLSFDFYVDCSGFRSLLLGNALRVPYQSYQKSLFTDSAVVGNAKHNGIIKPYTEARTMKNGWQWNIPMHTEDHMGYIYSSSFCSAEEAEREFRELNPLIDEVRTLKFKSGRHKDFVVGNVAAVGNSYGFIEALQSTALHMVITNIYALILYLKRMEKGVDDRKEVNKNLGEIWDKLKWFIAMQFKLNKRYQTEFWKACNQDVDISGIEGLIELYQKKGPLHEVKQDYSLTKESEMHQIYGLFSHDFMLLVLGVNPKELSFGVDERDKMIWRNKYAIWDQLAERAVYQHEILAKVESEPEILDFKSFFSSPFILKNEFDAINTIDIAEFIIKS